MKILIKHSGYEWTDIDTSQLEYILKDYKTRIEVRLPCEHKEYVLSDGWRKCKACGDMIKVI